MDDRIFNYDKDDYKNALFVIWDGMNPMQKAVLINLYNAANHSATSAEISLAAGYTDHRGFNLLCKNVGPRFLNTIGKRLASRTKGREPGYWRIWGSMDEKTPDGKWVIVMREGLVDAIRELKIDEVQETSFADPVDCATLLSEFAYERDVRKTPDSARKGIFRTGWLDATVRGKQYTERTLSQLTWNNLGYRLGKKFGPVEPTEIGAVYETFAQHYTASGSGAAQTAPEPEPFEVMPDEIAPTTPHIEGALRQVLVNRCERDRDARTECITHHGMRCSVCDMDFGERYGAIAEGFIHVHHLQQLSDVGEAHQVDPIADLRPVCPNCHAVIHKTQPPMSIEAVRELYEQARNN